jgi:hypothetical protein
MSRLSTIAALERIKLGTLVGKNGSVVIGICICQLLRITKHQWRCNSIFDLSSSPTEGTQMRCLSSDQNHQMHVTSIFALLRE